MGEATPRFWTPTYPPPQLNVGRRPPWGRGGGSRGGVVGHLRTVGYASISPSQGATLKRGSPYPQLKWPHRSVGVWKCEKKERKNTLCNHRRSPLKAMGLHFEPGKSSECRIFTSQPHRSVGVHHPNSSAEGSGSGACGQLGTFGAHRPLRPVPLTTNYWPEALGGGGGGHPRTHGAVPREVRPQMHSWMFWPSLDNPITLQFWMRGYAF